jgi:iron complex transport system substrate-binding protein
VPETGHWPQRVVCLTAETTEIAFALGCADRIAGVSGYAVRPPEARKKPRVAAFATAHVDRILALRPDLVLGFSDLQAGIVADLVKAGVQVLVTNQRTLAETSVAMRMIGGVLGRAAEAEALVAAFEDGLAGLAAEATGLPVRPRVYFEEWDEPMISGIGWVSELIGLAGGEDIFAGRAEAQGAAGRIVTAADVIAGAPDVIVASWCGKRANLARIAAREGWERIPAVRNGMLREIKSPDILQPGPSLLHGARQLASIIREAVRVADGARAH